MQGMDSGLVTHNDEPYLQGESNHVAVPKEEPEVVKQWRERRELQIQKRDELSASRKKEVIETAKRAIDDFYENYNVRKDKAIEKSRQEQKDYLDSRENTVSGGTAWQRICKLSEVSEKSKSPSAETNRFRELLVSLKDDANAPGA